MKAWHQVQAVGDEMVHLAVVADLLEDQGLLEYQLPEDVEDPQERQRIRLDAAGDHLRAYESRWFLAKAEDADHRPFWLSEGEPLPAGFHITERTDALNTLRRGVAELSLSIALHEPQSTYEVEMVDEAVKALGNISRELARSIQTGSEAITLEDLAERGTSYHGRGWESRLLDTVHTLADDVEPVVAGRVIGHSVWNLGSLYRIMSSVLDLVGAASYLPKITPVEDK